jgi:HlyD family secretion protein
MVEPIQNPTLSFVTGGKVAQVNAVVGAKVAAGTLLARLDTGILAANLAAAKAGLASAQSSASNSTQTVPDAILSAETDAESAVSTDTGYLFGNYTAQGRSPRFTSDDTEARNRLQKERVDVEDLITAWQNDDRTITSLDAASQAAMLDTDLARLATIRTYLRDLTAALASAEPNSFSGGVTLASARSGADAANAAVTNAVATLTAKKQSLTSAESGIPSANDAAIAAAKAQVDAAAAALAQAEVVAPFSGTVASVNVKAGDVAAPNSAAVTLVPDGAFQVPVYVTELDVASLKVGDRADVTLDAYGADRSFGASVSSIDTSPSTPTGGGVPAFKVILTFDAADPAIVNGMHANATIHAGSKEGALLVPRSALIEEGSATYVLKESGSTSVKTQVTVGLVGTDEAEITSGLSEGDRIATVGGN